MTYTVSDLNKQIKDLLSANWSSVITIEGEVSNLRISNGNIFMTLKDDVSKIDVVFWRYSDDTTELSNGKNVLVTGKLACWDKQGSYKITGFSVEIKGLGDLHNQFIKMKDDYEKAGYFSESNKKKLPEHIKKVGVITSVEGAALYDFLKVLEKNDYSGELFIKNCVVQGKDCPSTVSRAIVELDGLGLDLIVITRGGGSYEDLFGFSHPKILDEIYKSSTCIISAIGHEIDTMLSDYVADIRVATPSVAAEVIALHQKDKLNIDQVLSLEKTIKSKLSHVLKNYVIELSELNEMVDDPLDMIQCIILNLNTIIDNNKNKLRIKLNNHITELREGNIMIDNNNPKKVLDNGYIMLVDSDTGDQIKTANDLLFLKDLDDKKDKKLKLIFNDNTLLIRLESINLS
jgi:exodeoxyribonuclease VII large subunit